MKNSGSVLLLDRNKCYEQALINLKFALIQTFTVNNVWCSLLSELAAYIPHIRWIGFWEYKQITKPTSNISNHNISEASLVANNEGSYLHLSNQIGLEREHFYCSLVDPIIEARAIREHRNQIISQVRFDKDYISIDANTRSLMSVLIMLEDKILGVLSTESYNAAAFDIRDEIAFIKAGQLAIYKLKEIENETRT